MSDGTPSEGLASKSQNDRSSTDPGWTLLAQGQSRDALDVFAQQARKNPKTGTPKLGYALASALSGNLDDGIRAMRRVLRIDPQALHYLVLDQSLDATIELLAGAYRSAPSQADENQDTAFMVAALFYLQRDTGAARTQIAHAIELGDNSKSASNLRHLIDEEDPKPVQTDKIKPPPDR